MKCMYCGNEMEKGRIYVSETDSMPVSLIVWHAEKTFAPRDLFEVVKRHPVGIADTKDGYYERAYRCVQCRKVFGEFPTIE